MVRKAFTQVHVSKGVNLPSLPNLAPFCFDYISGLATGICSVYPAHAVCLADDITPLQTVGNADKAEADILAACRDNASAQVLYSLGIGLGISSWQRI